MDTDKAQHTVDNTIQDAKDKMPEDKNQMKGQGNETASKMGEAMDNTMQNAKNGMPENTSGMKDKVYEKASAGKDAVAGGARNAADAVGLDTDALFNKAVAYVQSSKEGAKSLDNETRLTFYKHYKQATEGDCNTEQPGFLSFKGRSMWDAWNSVKGTTTEQAKKLYVEALDKADPSWRNQ